MIRKTDAEEKLIALIQDVHYKSIIDDAREIAQRIWSSEVRIVKDYTDHGYEHSQRILGKLYEILNVHFDELTETELFLLILGAYLHDIGMQCDIKKHSDIKKLAEEKYSAHFEEEYDEGTANSYTDREQNEIRKNHHLLTGAWIEYSHSGETVLSGLVKKIPSYYLVDLIAICKYHSKLSINDCDEKSELSGIRTRFVATLLRFGDELDIDSERVHLDTVKAFGYKVENAVFWYLHARTKITIEDSEVKLSVRLNKEDNEKYGSCINHIYIQSFKNKNRLLTDILNSNNIHLFMSENSGIQENQFEESIPEEIALSLKQMYYEQLRLESISKLQLIDNSSEDEIIQQVLGLLLGKEEKADFMEKYKSEFLDKAARIKLLIDKMQSSCNLSREEVGKLAAIVEAVRRSRDKKLLIGNKPALQKIYKIMLFFKVFSAEQLTYLSDIGIRIPIQVYTGQAQPYVWKFLEKYYCHKADEQISDGNRWEFDDYTFEQIERIIRAYKAIIIFDPENIQFSDYYVYANKLKGKLLAVSVSGEENKILVWNVEEKKREPIAALGGLFEAVANVKIYRVNGKVYITACGNRQIYIWELNSGSGEPVYILKSRNCLINYVLFQSKNNSLCALGLSEKRIYIWRVFESQEPVAVLSSENDIYIINTHLSDAEDIYECLGLRSYSDNQTPRIVELFENADLQFEQKVVFEIYNTIDISLCTPDGYGNRINAYALDKERKALYLLINNTIYMYNFENSSFFEIEKRKGQRILNISTKNWKGKSCLLTYSIYQNYKKDKNLIHYYVLEEQNIIAHKCWALKTCDVQKAVFSFINEESFMYFCHLLDNTIYSIKAKSDDYSEFYMLPDSYCINNMFLE